MLARSIDGPTPGGRPFTRVVPAALGGCLLLVLVLVLAALAPAGADAGFGIKSFDGLTLNRDGSVATQAGLHPYEMQASLYMNTVTNQSGDPLAPDGNFKDIQVDAPAGLTGDPSAVPTCTDKQLLKTGEFAWGSCPPASQIGQLTVQLVTFGLKTIPLYNMVPSPGEPAQLGASYGGFPIYIDAHVRSGGDYGLTITLSDLTTLAPASSSVLTLWGVPGDPSHDAARGGGCSGDPSNPANCEGGGFSTGAAPRPYLTLPTSCAGPQETRLRLDSWQAPGEFLSASFLTHDNLGNPVGYEGCNRLSFTPSIAVAPEASAADSPTGLHVSVHLPDAGLKDPEGLAEADLRKAVVTLPAGTSVNPAIANGLAACSSAQIALSSPEPAACPDAAKIGTVEADVPVLDHPLLGGVYVAAQGDNPFGSLLAIYIAIQDPETGVVVKLAGHVVADPVTGQLTTTFENIPAAAGKRHQARFLRWSPRRVGEPRRVRVLLHERRSCTSWSSETRWNHGQAFEVNTGCHAPQFSPAFVAGTTSPQAGAFSALGVSLSRTDQDQGLGGVTVDDPTGSLGDPQRRRTVPRTAGRPGHLRRRTA